MPNNIKENKSSYIKSRYLPEIDGLRAFAVIAVIINHFNKELLPMGYLGVDIFFVISGFVITSSLYQRPSKNFKDFIYAFYGRRIKRLVAALSVFVLIMSITICLVNPYPGVSLITGLTSLFGFSNLYLLNQSTDYFAQSTQLNVFLHTWSLGVEEQFYILFPFLIWFSGFGQRTKYGVCNLVLTVGTLSIASIIGFLYLYPTNQSAAYFLMPTRFWEIAAGCLLFIGFKKRVSIEKLLKKFPPLLFLLLILAAMYLPISMALTSTILVVGLTAALIASLKKGTNLYSFFTNPKVVYAGQISYSLYLWHWGVISISRWTIGIHWWSVPFQITLIYALGVASYRWIEMPFRKTQKLKNRKIIFGFNIALLFTTSFTVFVVNKHLKLFSGREADLLHVGAKSLKRKLPTSNSNTNWSGTECWFDEENYTQKVSEIIKKCTFGNYFNSKRRIIVIGDSFAPAFAAMFDRTAAKTNYAFLVYSTRKLTKNYKPSGLSIISDYSDNFVSSEVFEEIISTLRPGDAIMWAGELKEVLDISSSYRGDEASIWFADGIQTLNKKIKKKELKLLFLGALPLAREANCMPSSAIDQWFNSLNPDKCSLPEKFATLSSADKLYKEITKRSRNIYLIDLFEAFCPKDKCDYFGESKELILYRDDASHASIEGAQNASGIFEEQIINIID